MPPDMPLSANAQRGTLLRLLPAIYQDAARSPEPGMGALGALLAAFEGVLLASEADRTSAPAVGERIDALPDLFKPIGPSNAELERTTPREFLGWLAQWIAIKPDLTELMLEPAVDGDAASAAAAERAFRNAIARIVPLYGSRGTRHFLEEALRLLIPEVVAVEIDDRDLPGFQVGRSAVGKDSWLVTYRPFHFSIRVRFEAASGDGEGIKRRQRKLRHKAETIIELSKPAHTMYDVRWEYGNARRDEIDV